MNDERFSALYSSHHFNIDPTNSHYHKTKGMEALRAEKLHRRQCQVNDITSGVSVMHDYIYTGLWLSAMLCAQNICELNLEVLQKF